MLATEYAQYYGIEAQREDESDFAFRNRVAGCLRDMGHIIEAHEAQQDQYYDQSDDVMTGITGAVAQTLYGINYGSSGKRQIGDDIAAGHLAQKPQDERGDGELALLMILLGMK